MKIEDAEGALKGQEVREKEEEEEEEKNVEIEQRNQQIANTIQY